MTDERKHWKKKPELKPGSKVRITQHARDQNISVNAPTGTVIRKDDLFGVVVKRDRFKTPGSYNNCFWELDGGEDK